MFPPPSDDRHGRCQEVIIDNLDDSDKDFSQSLQVTLDAVSIRICCFSPHRSHRDRISIKAQKEHIYVDLDSFLRCDCFSMTRLDLCVFFWGGDVYLAHILIISGRMMQREAEVVVFC